MKRNVLGSRFSTLGEVLPNPKLKTPAPVHILLHSLAIRLDRKVALLPYQQTDSVIGYQICDVLESFKCCKSKSICKEVKVW